jgi:3-isopropylmalate/(R)-2-methylmalate dehydratase small subunit
VLPKSEIDTLFGLVEYTPGFALAVNLEAQTLTRPDGYAIAFEVDPFRKECLLNGWDDIGLTLRHAEKIRAFEERRKQMFSWLFA